jgi:hypothetical protein
LRQQSGQTTQQQTAGTQSQTSSTPQSGQGRDEAAARQALMQAKDALTEVTTMPEAAKLQGQARTQVVEVINGFNALLTAEANWFEKYQDVERSLTQVLGPQDSATGTSGSGEATGTGTSGSATGTTASSSDMPAPIRAKLALFRQRLTEFARAAGAPAAGGTASSMSGATGTSGSTTSGSTSTQSGTTGAQSATGTGTTGSQSATGSTSGETLEQHIDAISDLIQQALSQSAASATAGTTGTSGTTGSGSTTTGSGTTGTTGTTPTAIGSVTMDRATVDQIQSHLQRLRELARTKGIK